MEIIDVIFTIIGYMFGLSALLGFMGFITYLTCGDIIDRQIMLARKRRETK